MSDLTPERIRDAAEVVRAFSAPPHVWTSGESDAMVRAARLLDNIAAEREREQAAEAQREKRVGQLAGELLSIHLDTRASGKWPDFARALLDRYPLLVHPGPCDKGPCCLDNHHEGQCEL